MDLNLPSELARLRRLSVGRLRAKYAELFGEATQSNNRTWLIRRLAWRLQALAEGDLSERARRRAAELARDADLRLAPPASDANTTAASNQAAQLATRRSSPRRGAALRRPYKGQIIEVLVQADGYAYAGQVYRSLSAVAKVVTGAHWNGRHFFGLGRGGRP
jgi:hypothetical protein